MDMPTFPRHTKPHIHLHQSKSKARLLPEIRARASLLLNYLAFQIFFWQPIWFQFAFLKGLRVRVAGRMVFPVLFIGRGRQNHQKG
jgi:hypothetical protein